MTKMKMKKKNVCVCVQCVVYILARNTLGVDMRKDREREKIEDLYRK
jgi:uncharacterized membrane protein